MGFIFSYTLKLPKKENLSKYIEHEHHKTTFMFAVLSIKMEMNLVAERKIFKLNSTLKTM